jgi:hypothetical protein
LHEYGVILVEFWGNYVWFSPIFRNRVILVGPLHNFQKNRVILVEFWALFTTICILSKCRDLSIKSKVDRGLIYDSGDV